MIAVDTNVVVRFLTADDAAQARRSRALFASHEVWISLTVLLETEWVLRGGYRLDRKNVNSALTALVQMEAVEVENHSSVFEALKRHSSGWDFADALHLVGCPPEVSEFYSFDRTLVKKKSVSIKLKTP